MTEKSQESLGLGSLSQAVRSKTLFSAQVILIMVGILTVGANCFLFMTAEKQADAAVQAEINKQGSGMIFDQEKLKEAKQQITKVVQLVAGGTVVLGFVFIVLGVVVYKIPVAATVLGLFLYVGAAILFGLLDPSSLASGIIIKIFIVIGLVKAVQSAIAYQKERTIQKSAGV